MSTKEAEVFHKLRVATPLSTRSGHPVSVVFNGISANAWLSPIGISHEKKEKDSRGERFIAQRPHTAGSIAIVRHHPKPCGIQRSEILTGRQLPVNSNCCHSDQTSFRRPMAFEDDYTSPIGSHMYNQKVIKKGYRGGGFCDGPPKRQRPYTSIPQMRIVKETPITLELTVKSLEFNRGSSGKGSGHAPYDDDRNQQQLLNVNAYEDLSRTCIQRAKSAPAGSRPTGGSKSPSLYWRARSAYHRKLMTPTPDPEVDQSEDTQVIRGSMLRPLMYSSNTDIQHSAGCPYKCKGCFKACLVSQDYLEKSKRRPVRVRRDLRQRSMMKKDPRYILHQALARNQPIYKLVHDFCDERSVREAWIDGRAIRGHQEDNTSPSEQCSVVGENDVSNTVSGTEVVLSETNSQDGSSEKSDSVGELSEVVTEGHDVQERKDTIDTLADILPDKKNMGINRRVKSAEHRKVERSVDLKDRPKSCSPGHHNDNDYRSKSFKSELLVGGPRKKVSDSLSDETIELKRGNASDISDSESDRKHEEDSKEDRRGSTSTVTSAQSTVSDRTYTESMSSSNHHKHSKSRKGRMGERRRNQKKQHRSSEDESCSTSEEEDSPGSDSTVEDKRYRKKSKQRSRRHKNHENSDSSVTVTEQSASENSESSESRGYSSCDNNPSYGNSDFISETDSEMTPSKKETQQRKLKETKKDMRRKPRKRFEKYTDATSDDKTVEESSDGRRTPGTVDYAPSEINSATESELQFDTASHDSRSVKVSRPSSSSTPQRSTRNGSRRSSSSTSQRSTRNGSVCSSLTNSVRFNSDHSSTKGPNRSTVCSSDKSIKYSDNCNRETPERSSTNSVHSNRSKVAIKSNVKTINHSRIKTSDRYKDKKSKRSKDKAPKRKSKDSDSSSVNSDSDEESSSSEESSNSSSQSDTSNEECVKKSRTKRESKSKAVKKSKSGRKLKVHSLKTKKKDSYEEVGEKQNNSDDNIDQTERVAVEIKTVDRELTIEKNNSDNVKSENISGHISEDNRAEYKRKSGQGKRRANTNNLKNKRKEKGRRAKAKKCDDDERGDDKSSDDDTSAEEKEEDSDDEEKTESDDEDKDEEDTDGSDDSGRSLIEKHKNKKTKSKTKTPKKVLKKSQKITKSGKASRRAKKLSKGDTHKKRKCSDSEFHSDNDAGNACSESEDTSTQTSEESEGDTDSGGNEGNQTRSKTSTGKYGNKIGNSSDEHVSDKEESDKSDSSGSVADDKDTDSDTGDQSDHKESSSDTEEESEDESDDDDDDDSG